jgi:hypothetical protein
MALFGSRTFLDAEDETWQIETWQWLIRELGPVPGLITPTRAFFPSTTETGARRVEHIFKCIKQHAGMDHLHCRLMEQPRSASLRVGDVAALKRVEHAPAGTFAVEGNEAVVSYDPAQADDPLALVVVLIHELAHYRLAHMRHAPPGGEDLHEYTTDLLTVYLGFGTFSAASAFNFSQHQDVMSQGWRYSRLGYLGERGFVFALAIFLELRDQSSEDVKTFLKPHLFADLLKARRYLVKRSLLPRETFCP